MVKRGIWLSLTPEPERELPRLLATLAHGAAPPPEALVVEEQRIRRLVLRGTQQSWLRYLHRAVELVESRSADADPVLAEARTTAIKVLANYHNLLLGLPGSAARRTAVDRRRLAALEHTDTKDAT